MNKTRRLTVLALSVTLAMVLSYLELLLPPLSAAVPGIKPGLANILIVFVLYRMGVKDAILVSFLRLTLSALLFGSILSLAYSAAGACLSLLGMSLLRRLDRLSVVGVSVVGGVLHNAGQILVAAALMRTAQVGYYMIVLTVTGTVSGVLVGLAGGLLLRYIKVIK
jgi:heptaprenyl diphosphate synthase